MKPHGDWGSTGSTILKNPTCCFPAKLCQDLDPQQHWVLLKQQLEQEVPDFRHHNVIPLGSRTRVIPSLHTPPFFNMSGPKMKITPGETPNSKRCSWAALKLNAFSKAGSLTQSAVHTCRSTSNQVQKCAFGQLHPAAATWRQRAAAPVAKLQSANSILTAAPCNSTHCSGASDQAPKRKRHSNSSTLQRHLGTAPAPLQPKSAHSTLTAAL